MPILDRSRIPQEKLDFMDRFMAGRVKYTQEFLVRPENENIDFPSIWARVMKGNEEFFKAGKLTDELKSLLSYEERVFLARMLRNTGDEYTLDFLKENPLPDAITVEKIDAGGVPAEWQKVKGASGGKVIMYIHGGGWIQGSALDHRELTSAMAVSADMNVLSLDYRLAPEHRFPAQMEDCVKGYDWLLNQGLKPENIIIAGDSAGGNLTLITLLKLKDDRKPLPAGAICLAPATDVALSTPGYFTNGPTDPILSDLGIFWWIDSYVLENDPTNPYISPIYGDLAGLPPILVQAANTEMLYAESARYVEKAKAAGVDATLQTWNDTLHVFQMFGLHEFPEATEAIEEMGKFAKRIVG